MGRDRRNDKGFDMSFQQLVTNIRLPHVCAKRLMATLMRDSKTAASATHLQLECICMLLLMPICVQMIHMGCFGTDGNGALTITDLPQRHTHASAWVQ